jgi:hypothetical protein
MEHTEREHELETAEVAIQLGGIADSEFGAINERPPGAIDIRLADVDPDVAHVTEMLEQSAGTAAKVEDAHTAGRSNVLSDEQAPSSLTAEHPRKELVDRWARQDASNVDQVGPGPRPRRLVTGGTLAGHLEGLRLTRRFSPAANERMLSLGDQVLAEVGAHVADVLED